MAARTTLDYIPLHVDLPAHRKSLRLQAVSGVERAWTYAAHAFLWIAQNRAADGDVGDLTPEFLDPIVGWPRKAKLPLLTALREAGFLDPDGRVHDWGRYAGSFFVQRAKEREKKARQRRGDVPGDSDRTGAGRPAPEGEREGEGEGERDLISLSLGSDPLDRAEPVESVTGPASPEDTNTDEHRLLEAFSRLGGAPLRATPDRLALLSAALHRWTYSPLAQSLEGYALSPFWKEHRAQLPTFEAFFRDENGAVERGLLSRQQAQRHRPPPPPRLPTEPSAEDRARGAETLARLKQSLPWQRSTRPTDSGEPR